LRVELEAQEWLDRCAALAGPALMAAEAAAAAADRRADFQGQASQAAPLMVHPESPDPSASDRRQASEERSDPTTVRLQK
jgi:hypothetical protein